MAENPGQMVLDVFWNQIQKLQALSTGLKADLDADRAKLIALWSSTKRDLNRARAAQNQAVLTPQVHNNSVLRMRYQGLAAAFNKALDFARDALKRAGYQPSAGLAGLGQVPLPVLVPAVAAAALATAFLIYQSVRTATDAQRRATAALAKLVEDPTASPEQRAAAAAALGKASQPTGLVAQLAPVLGILAALVILPSLLPRRREA